MIVSAWTDRIIITTSGTAAVTAGLYLLLQPWDLTSTHYVLAAAVSIIVSALLIQGPGTSWPIVTSFFLFGLYMLARGLGLLSYQYLRYSAGVLFFAFGFYLLMRLLTPPPSDFTKPDSRN